MPFDTAKAQGMLKAVAQMMDAYSKQQQQQQGGSPFQLSPPKVGQLLPPAHVTYDPSHATGTMTSPIAQPIMPTYAPPPGGEMLSSKLTPSGSAAYAGVQGVAQFLSQWQQKREMKQQGEAANIAQNLMQAIQNGDTATAHEIMNDPKATKILNKVYKGWLTPAKQEKKKEKPPDPELQGFEQGLQKQLQQYEAGKTQQQPPMPRQMGGYLTPSAAPAQMMQEAVRNIQEQQLKQHPEYALSISPREQVELQEKMAQMGFTANLEKTLASGYMTALRMAEEQQTIFDREMAVQKARGETQKEIEDQREQNRLQIEKLRGQFRKDLAGQILGAKKGSSAHDVTFQALNSLLHNATTRKDSLQSSYTQLMKSNPDAAQTLKTQIDAEQKYIDNLNQQMQDLSDKSTIDKALEYLLLGGQEPSGE
jgi:hypothetical protein